MRSTNCLIIGKNKLDFDPEKVLLEVDKTLILAHANPDAGPTRNKLN